MVAAITAKEAALQNVIEHLEMLNLDLESIYIPELALSNLTALDEDNEKSNAFIYFYKELIIFNITFQKNIYFSRQIPLPPGGRLDTAFYENISLDILRYFDYFQSQWRHPSPNQIFIGTEIDDAVERAKLLSKHLMMQVSPYSLSSVLLDDPNVARLDHDFLLEIGCALCEVR